MAEKNEYQIIRVIDSHTGGEPTRTVIEGFPSLGKGTVAKQRQRFEAEFDHWRKALILEPKGNEVLVGALLCPPAAPDADIGVIFFNNAGYLGMCGHGTMGLIASLHHLGWFQPGKYKIETPVGLVEAVLHEDKTVSIHNVLSYRYQKNITVNVPGVGDVRGDIAWGGNWFFLISQHGYSLTTHHIDELTQYSWAVRQALEQAGITGENGECIDHIELFAPDNNADSRNFVLCPGKAYDRSPCGTGTSTKLACLAADGKLQPGEVWRQSSIIGSVFEAQYQWVGQKIAPVIRGTAYVYGDNQLIIAKNDPFVWGISV
ncbi:4-hydroxyproline epimerase [Photorhabdus stackebrandtii]|uniref:4-hydroxyproline 2-epimerase n=1 Tax=Photorhabdus stackebrandtii TaxID=1123042 RepID=A0A7X5QLQ6_9GAMM|nr:4-hydroxyproline epimerase [Photorhabdus stackebrandtii]NHB96627.1 4-hydroxyproline epimerase [Photorhabdus stackebrandtii]